MLDLGVNAVSTYFLNYYNQGEPDEVFKNHFSDISDGSYITKLVRISSNSQAMAVGCNSGNYGCFLIFGYGIGCKLLTLWDGNWEEVTIVTAPH